MEAKKLLEEVISSFEQRDINIKERPFIAVPKKDEIRFADISPLLTSQRLILRWEFTLI